MLPVVPLVPRRPYSCGGIQMPIRAHARAVAAHHETARGGRISLEVLLLMEHNLAGTRGGTPHHG